MTVMSLTKKDYPQNAFSNVHLELMDLALEPGEYGRQRDRGEERKQEGKKLWFYGKNECLT
jgi:hypothetical protein